MTSDPSDDNGAAARAKMTEFLTQGRKSLARQMGVNLPEARTNRHPERDLQTACLQWLTLKRIYHYRLNNVASTIYTGGKMVRLPVAQRGLPDIVILVNGIYCAAELKSETGRQSDEQKAVEEATNKAGGQYRIIKSLDEMIAWISPLTPVQN